MSSTLLQKISTLTSIANTTVHFYFGEHTKRWIGVFNQDLAGSTIKLTAPSQESFSDAVDALYERVISASTGGIKELVPLQLTVDQQEAYLDALS